MAEDINVTVRMQLAEDLAEEFRGQFEAVQKIINATKLTLNLSKDEPFLKDLRASFKEALTTVKQIRDELQGGIKIKLEINDITHQVEDQLTKAMNEALSKVLPDAKKLGKAIGDEASKGVAKTISQGKSKARQGATNVRDPESAIGNALRKGPKKLVDGNALAEELVEDLERARIELTKKRNELTSILGGLAHTIDDNFDQIEKGLREGGKGINDAISILSSRAAKNIGRDLRNTNDQLLDIVGTTQRLASRYKELSTQGKIEFDKLAPAGLKLTINQAEDLLRLTNQIGRAADSQLRLYDRRLRDTAQTTKFLEESTLKFAKAVRSNDASELEGINIQHRSLGQKLSREVISLKEQQQLYGSIRANAAELARESEKALAGLSADDGDRAGIEGDLAVYKRITADYGRRIELLKEEEVVTQRQRQQVEQVADKNRANIRIIKERNRINEAALRQSTQLVAQTQQQVSSVGALVRKYKQAQDNGELLDTKTAERAKKEINGLNNQLDALDKNFFEAQRAGVAASRALEKQFKNLSGPFANLTGSDARAQFSKLITEQDQINKKREQKVIESQERIKNRLKDVGDSGILSGIGETEEVDKARSEVDRLAQAFERLKERTRGIATGGASDELEDLAINIKGVRTEETGLVRDTDKVLAKLRELSSRNLISVAEYKAQANAIKSLRVEQRGLSADGVFKGAAQQAKGADVVKFLKNDYIDAREALARFDEQLETNKQLLNQGPAGTLAAAQGFKRLNSEVSGLQNKLADLLLSYTAAERRGTTFNATEREQIKQINGVAVALANTSAKLKRQAAELKAAEIGATRAGQGFRLYNQELAASIINNARFINSMTIITSGIFLLRRGLQDIIEESKAFARTMTVLQSQTLSLTEAFDAFRASARDTAVEFGVAITEVAEVVKQFGSAGLTAEESLGALRDTMRLIISTSAEAEEVTRTVAGIYNVFGEDLKEVGDEFAAFGKITDTLTSVYRNHQAELDEMVQGFRFASATGKAAGFQFQEISAFLAVLNDNLIKSGAAGRGLQVVFAQLAKKAPQLADSLGVAIDPKRPLNDQFLSFLGQINQKLGEGTIITEDLSRAFQVFGLRGARSAVTLAQNFDQVVEALDEMENAKGTAAELAEIVQSQLANSFERAKQALLELVRDSIAPLQQFFIIASSAILQLREGFRAIEKFGGTSFGAILLVIGTVVIASQSFLAVLQVMLIVVSGATKSFSLLKGGVDLTTASIQKKTIATIADAEATALWEAENQKAAASFKSLSGGLSPVQIGIGVILTLLPVFIAAWGRYKTTVAEVRSELEGLQAEFGRLNRTRRDLRKFGSEFSKVAKLIKGETLGVEASARLLRKTVNTLGASFVNTFEIAATSSDKLIKNFGDVEKSIRSQISAQERLNNARERIARRDEIRLANQDLQVQFLDPGSTDPNAAHVKQIATQQLAVESLFKSLNSSDARIALNTARGLLNPQDLAGTSDSFGLNTALQYGEIASELKAIQPLFEEYVEDHNGTLDGLFEGDQLQNVKDNLLQFQIKLSDAMTKASGDFVASANIAGKSDDDKLDLAAKIITGDQTKTFKQLEGDAKEGARRFAQLIQDVNLTAVTKLSTASVDPFASVLANQQETFRGLQNSIDSVTYDAWINQVEDARDAAGSVRTEIEGLIKSQDGALSIPASALDAVIGTRLKSFSAQELNELTSTLFTNFDGTIPLALDEEALQEQLENDIDFQVAVSVGDKDLEKYKDRLRNANRAAVIEGIFATITEFGLADEFGLITADAGDVAEIFNQIISRMGDGSLEFKQLVNELINLSQTNLFEATLVAVSNLQFKSLLDQAKAQKRQNTRGRTADQFRLAKQQAEALSFIEVDGELKKVTVQEKLIDLQKQRNKIAKQAANDAATALGTTLEDIAASGDKDDAEAVKAKSSELLSQNKIYQELTDFQNELVGYDVKRVKEGQKLRAIDVKNINASTTLFNLAKTQSLQLTGQLAIEEDKLKVLEHQRRGRESELRITGELTESSLNGLAARKELADIDRQILQSQRDIRDALIDERVLRDNLLAKSEQLLDRQNKFAGIGHEARAIFREIARIEEQIGKSIADNNSGLLTGKDYQSQITEQIERYVDFGEQAFELQDKLNDELKETNNLMGLRLSIVEKIRDTFKSEENQASGALTTLLERQFDENGLATAEAAAKALGISTRAAFANFGELIPQLVEGISEGTISIGQFGARFASLAQPVVELRAEFNGVSDKLAEIRDIQLVQLGERFDVAFKAKNFKDAEAALNSLFSATQAQFADNPKQLTDELNKLLPKLSSLQDLIGVNQAAIKLRIDFDLGAFDILEERFRQFIDTLNALQADGPAFIPGLGELKLVTDGSLLQAIGGLDAGVRLLGESLKLPGYQTGGRIPGFGGGDIVPALLEPGEFVIPKEAVSKFGGGVFEALRSGRVPKFQDGGLVGVNKKFSGLINSNETSLLLDLVADAESYGEFTSLRRAIGNGDFNPQDFVFAVQNFREAFSTGTNDIFADLDGLNKDGSLDDVVASYKEQLLGFNNNLQDSVIKIAQGIQLASNPSLSIGALGTGADAFQSGVSGFFAEFEKFQQDVEDRSDAINELQAQIDKKKADAKAARARREAAKPLSDEEFQSLLDVYRKIGSDAEARKGQFDAEAFLRKLNNLDSSRDEPVRRFRTGGGVPGFGGGDIVPALLEPGEFVIPKEAVKSLGPSFFEAVRSGRVRGFVDGGPVGDSSKFLSQGAQNNRQTSLLLDPDTQKAIKEYEKAFEKALEKAYGSKENLNILLDGITETFVGAGEIFADFLSTSFALDGGKAIGAAITSYEDALKEIERGFAETFTGLERGLAKNETDFLSFIDSVQEAELERFKARAEAEQALREEIEKTNDLFASFAIGTVADTISGLSGAVKNLGPDAKVLRQSFTDLTAAFKTGLLSKDPAAFQGILSNTISSSLLGAAAGIGGLILDGFAGALSFLGDPQALENTLKGFETFANNLIDNADQIVDVLVEGASRLAEAFVEKLPDILNTLVEQLPRLLEGLANVLKENLPKIIQSLADALPDLIRALVPIIADIAVILLENIPKIVEAMAIAVPVLIVEIIKQLPKIIFALLKASVLLLPSLILGLFKGILEALVPGVLKGIGGAFSKIGGLLGDTFDKIGSLFKNLTDEQKKDRKETRQELKDLGINTKELRKRGRDQKKNPDQVIITPEEREFLKKAYPKRFKELAQGGRIPGFGGGDIVPAMLEPGEFVIPKNVVRDLGPDFFEALRTSRFDKFKAGGIVGGTGGFSNGMGPSSVTSINQTNNINVSVGGNASEEQKQKTADDLVDRIDRGLERKRRNRSLALDI